MKKLICIALALVMVLGLAVTVSAEGPRVTLTYAEVNPIEGTIVGMIATYFKEQVETLTNGSSTFRPTAFWATKHPFWMVSCPRAAPLTSPVSPLSL